MMDELKKSDPEIYETIINEARRQHDGLELIASENFVSMAVLEALGSVMTNKYAEGYPGKRYYGGCINVDKAENIAREQRQAAFRMRACQCPAALAARRPIWRSISRSSNRAIRSWGSISRTAAI